MDYVPNPALAHLKNPYDGRLNGPYRLLDLCYYQNRYFSPGGIAPILLIALPWHFLFGNFLQQGSMVFVFVYGSLLLSLFIFHEIWRVYLRDVPFALVAIGSGFLTFGNLALLHLLAGNFYQVAQSGANFCQLASLTCGMLALRTGQRWLCWLGLASLAAGLAVASRASFLFGGISLLPIGAVIAQRMQRDQPDRPTASCWASPILIAALPSALICAALLWYNWLRFGSVLEFGGSYVLAGVDPQKLKLISLKYLGKNLAAFLGNRPGTIHYFPFFRYIVYPVSLLYFPLLLLIGGAFLVPGNQLRKKRPELAGIAIALLLATLGNFAIPAVYVESWLRYEVDFLVPGFLAAMVGWLLLYQSLSANPRFRAIVIALGSSFALVTVLNVLLISAAVCPPDRLSLIAKISNRMVGLIDAARGSAYGPVRLQVVLPAKSIQQRAPLVTTGSEDKDCVYLEPAGKGMIRVGYDHAYVGGPISDTFDPGNGVLHTVDIAMGSLLPAGNQAFFDGWSEAEIYRAKHLLRISWDGVSVLEEACDFNAAGPSEVRFGAGEANSGSTAASAIKVTALQRPRFDRTFFDRGVPKFEGYARFVLRFSANLAERREPLLATGRPGAADLLFVHYLADGKLRFGVDNWNGGLIEGVPLEVDRGKAHSAYLAFGSLNSDGTTGHTFVLLIDGHIAAEAKFPFHPTAAGNIVWGLNPVNSSVAGEMFSGTISGISPISRTEFEHYYHPPISAPVNVVDGRISLTVRFDYSYSAAGQPLVVTGREGAGDFIYVIYDNDYSVHFGFDHWGSGGISGPTIPLDFSRTHLLVVTMGSLHNNEPATQAERETVRVVLDGKIVLDGKSPCHPSAVKEIEIGRNDIGGSSCGVLFSGKILGINGKK